MAIKRKAAPMPIPGRDVAMTTTTATLSPQQEAVVTWVKRGRGSLFVEAVAGSGKTTTLIEACRQMRGDIALAAFNKKIADEIKTKVNSQPGVRVGTFHSFGFAAWRNVAPSVRVEADIKSRQMVEDCAVPYQYRAAVRRAVSIAKQSVVGLLWRSDEYERWLDLVTYFDLLLQVDQGDESDQTATARLIDMATRCVDWSREQGQSLIDFDDMLWLPLLEDAPVRTYDWVLVDEAQDTNAARRLLAERMMRRGGRSLWVGDRHQAIYGFTGADADAVDIVMSTFGCSELPLSVTFRCGKEATKLAQSWVPQIEPGPANLQGSVREASAYEFRSMVKSDQTPDQRATMPPLAGGDAILCRNTKPLVSLAFDLIREGVPCCVEGRDIGRQLEQLATKWKVETIVALITNLEAYRQRETEKLVARDARYAVEALNDRIDTLIVLTEGLDTVAELRSRIDSMFKDTGDGGLASRLVTLSTIHKAKGREWDRVFILGWSVYMPSRWATQDWEKQQEANLAYVAVTRTKRDLVLLPALDR